MAYTKQTWTDNVSVASAARLGHMEDGIFDAIPKDLVDAAGDLLVGTAADTVGRLAKGTALQVLRVNSGATALEWAAATAATVYKKTTAKAVNTTTSATDLLNAEITVAAGVMGATGSLKFRAWGDWLQNSGGAAAAPRLQLVFGGTTIFDTGAPGSATNSATRHAWRMEATFLNITASTQSCEWDSRMSMLVTGAAGNNFTTGTGRMITPSQLAIEDILFGVAINTSSINTAIARTLVLNTINGSANAAYETKLLGAEIVITP